MPRAQVRVIPALAVLLATSASAGSPVPTSPLPPQAYAVYNTVLRAFLEDDLKATVSIVRDTTLHDVSCLPERQDRQWASAVADLTRRNASPVRLEPRFTLPFRFELADELEPLGGARAPTPWENPDTFLADQIAKLEDQDRRHYTQVQLSVPGFSDDGRLAIVYLSMSFTGHFRVLRRHGRTWTAEETACWWIS